MKRSLLPVLAAVLAAVVLCSCGRALGAETLTQSLYAPYEAEAAVTDGDNVYRVSVVRNADGDITFTFIEPAALAGISYRFDGDGAAIVYKDLSVPYGEGADRLSHGVTVWKKLMAAEGEFSAKKSDGGYVCSNGESEMFFDGQTLAPTLIKNDKITISISGFRQTNDKSSEGAGADITGGT
jgi:hypothetical protein